MSHWEVRSLAAQAVSGSAEGGKVVLLFTRGGTLPISEAPAQVEWVWLELNAGYEQNQNRQRSLLPVVLPQPIASSTKVSTIIVVDGRVWRFQPITTSWTLLCSSSTIYPFPSLRVRTYISRQHLAHQSCAGVYPMMK